MRNRCGRLRKRHDLPKAHQQCCPTLWHRATCDANYHSMVKRIVKVLDFVQRGGPDLTVDSTIFEMWIGL